MWYLVVGSYTQVSVFGFYGTLKGAISANPLILFTTEDVFT